MAKDKNDVDETEDVKVEDVAIEGKPKFVKRTASRRGKGTGDRSFTFQAALESATSNDILDEIGNDPAKMTEILVAGYNAVSRSASEDVFYGLLPAGMDPIKKAEFKVAARAMAKFTGKDIPSIVRSMLN